MRDFFSSTAETFGPPGPKLLQFNSWVLCPLCFSFFPWAKSVRGVLAKKLCAVFSVGAFGFFCLLAVQLLNVSLFWIVFSHPPCMPDQLLLVFFTAFPPSPAHLPRSPPNLPALIPLLEFFPLLEARLRDGFLGTRVLTMFTSRGHSVSIETPEGFFLVDPVLVPEDYKRPSEALPEFFPCISSPFLAGVCTPVFLLFMCLPVASRCGLAGLPFHLGVLPPTPTTLVPVPPNPFPSFFFPALFLPDSSTRFELFTRRLPFFHRDPFEFSFIFLEPPHPSAPIPTHPFSNRLIC